MLAGYEEFKQMNKGKKGAHEPKAQMAGAYPSVMSMKHLGVLLLPNGRDAGPSQGYPLAVCRQHPFIAGFQPTSQRPGWWTRTKAFPPLRKKKFFHANFAKNFLLFCLPTWLPCHVVEN